LPIEAGTGIIEGFEGQILGHLNAGGSLEGLREAFSGLTLTDSDGTVWQGRAQVVPVDVTGNKTPDVVIGLTFSVEGQYADGALFVFGCRERAYEGGAIRALGGQVFAGGSPDPGIRAIQDMNSNGVPEIVYSFVSVIGTHGNFTRLFHILEWNGTEFVDLVDNDVHPPQAAPVNNGDGAVLDTNGNRNLELVLTNGIGHYYEDGGPQRERTDVWFWNGYAFTLASVKYEDPVYRFQAVQDGDDAALEGKYNAALSFYQRVISDDGLLGWSEGQLWPDAAYGGGPTPTPDPGERARLSAYAAYRTMLVYVVQGLEAEAQSAYGTLQAQFLEGEAGHPYAKLASVFWQVYSGGGDISAACTRAVEYASVHTGEVLAPLSGGFYGYLNREYTAEDVCPFR
jgi:hypothetical protein